MSSEKQEGMGWLRSDSGRALSSFFFKRGSKLEYFRPGSTFRRVQRDGLIETAQVPSVGPLPMAFPKSGFRSAFAGRTATSMKAVAACWL